jgi:hypothetical protein
MALNGPYLLVCTPLCDSLWVWAEHTDTLSVCMFALMGQAEELHMARS